MFYSAFVTFPGKGSFFLKMVKGRFFEKMVKGRFFSNFVFSLV